MIIHPYKLGSRSAKRLKEVINASSEGSRICHILQREPKGKKCLVVNWGSSEIKYPEGNNWIINSPKDVCDMSDKVKFFEKVGHDADFLSWTRNREEAAGWVNAGSKVFVRNLTRGSGGRGIDVWTAERGDAVPSAPLYTRHQPKTHEYRLHMARSLNGNSFEPILVQRKVWKNDDKTVQPKTWDVRSHDNGFIFQAYPDLSKVPPSVVSVSRSAMAKHFGDMHFVALDVLYHQPSDKPVICEGNTAPGLENNTVDVYAEYFLGLNEEFKKERMVYL